MLAAKSRLESRGFHVNAQTGRHVSKGVQVLRRKERAGRLRTQVVVHLGTNGTFRPAQCRAMHRIAGKQRNLFLVTVKVPRSWQRSNNRVIERCARRYTNTLLVDWQRVARQHPGLVRSDGYHLTRRGARRYTRLLDHAVDNLGKN